MGNPLASVIIPTWNHLESDLKPCVKSILECTDMSRVEVVVVANGCKDGTEEWVRSLGSPFRLVSVPEPLGYTKAMNMGLAMARCEYVVPLNNDVTFLDDSWLDTLVRPFLLDQAGNVGIAGPTKHFWGHRPYVVFECVMFRRKLLYEIGFLDDVFSPGAGEDTDFCVRLSDAGYKVVQVPMDHPSTEIPFGFPIWHKGDATVHEFPGWEQSSRRNRQLLEDRYEKVISSKPRNALEMFSGPYEVANRSRRSMDGLVPTAQLQWEFSALVDVFREIRPSVTVEIGAGQGGSLWHWITNSRPGSTMVSVDLVTGNSESWRGWAKNARIDLHVLNGDSASMETFLKVRTAAVPAIDFLFLDGGCGYLSALADFSRYAPLVRCGGAIALHGILHDPKRPAAEAWRLWQEIRSAGYKVRELYSGADQEGDGIGIVYP
jgi:GT2 family glycosyltransferase/predicted O-methyltransferase YrrM